VTGVPAAMLILDSTESAWFNMAADDYLADQLAPVSGFTFIRFYQWANPTVSLGCFQSELVIDRQECIDRKWEIVRRPTGGRALLHWGDISYSVTIPGEGDRLIALKQIYSLVANAFVTAFQQLGIPADIGAPGSYRTGGTVSTGTRLCLDTHTRGEVTVNGQKIAAAAQKLYLKSALQHGSVPLTGDTGAIAYVTAGIENSRREQLAQRIRRSATTVETAANRLLSSQQLITAFVPCLEQELQLKTEPYRWQNADLQEISLRREKFEIRTLSEPN